MLNADTIKTAGRLTRNRLGAGAVLPQPAAEPVTEGVKPAEVLTVRQAMSRKNPALEQLVDTLDLEETSAPAYVVLDSVEPVQVVALATVEVVAAVDDAPATAPPAQVLPAHEVAKLERLARRAIPEGDSYSRAEVINLIVTATAVTEQRAAHGFELMLTNGVLSTTPAQTYYLNGTVPF